MTPNPSPDARDPSRRSSALVRPTSLGRLASAPQPCSPYAGAPYGSRYSSPSASLNPSTGTRSSATAASTGLRSMSTTARSPQRPPSAPSAPTSKPRTTSVPAPPAPVHNAAVAPPRNASSWAELHQRLAQARQVYYRSPRSPYGKQQSSTASGAPPASQSRVKLPVTAAPNCLTPMSRPLTLVNVAPSRAGRNYLYARVERRWIALQPVLRRLLSERVANGTLSAADVCAEQRRLQAAHHERVERLLRLGISWPRLTKLMLDDPSCSDAELEARLQAALDSRRPSRKFRGQPKAGREQENSPRGSSRLEKEHKENT